MLRSLPVSSASSGSEPAEPRSPSLRALRRRARQLQRSSSLSHCAALDCVAREQGFGSWSLLAAKTRRSPPQAAAPPSLFPWDAADIFGRLRAGQCLLLGSRPGQGKTARAVALLTQALRSANALDAHGLPCWFFSLANDPTRVAPLFAACGEPRPDPRWFSFVHSDALCSTGILEHIRARVRPRSLIVIDHLQLLDQRRSSPELQLQVEELAAFARQSGCIFLFLSQLRSELDAEQRTALPADVRLPNALDLTLFDQLVLLHRGSERWHAAG